MKRLKFISVLLTASLLAGITACSSEPSGTTSSSMEQTTTAEVETEETTSEPEITETTRIDPQSTEPLCHIYFEEYDSFEVTSTDLVDGVWADITSNTFLGENLSPQLSWEPVEGAEEYVIYMVDRNSNGFLQWKSAGIKTTELPQGWTSNLTEYNGPHLGHGYTHIYDIYVIALRAPTTRLKGALNAANPRLEEFFKEIDTDTEGNTGNIIAYGTISGIFTDARYRTI